jgi:hypothetical protein
MDVTAIAQWVKDKIDYLKLGFASLLTVLGKGEQELIDLLDLAIEDGPKLIGVLGTLSNFATTVLPNGQLGSYLNTAALLIGQGLPYVKTAEGIVMSLAQATAIGAHTESTPLTSAQGVAAMMAKAHPDVPTELHDALVPIVAIAVAQGVKEVAPAVIGA